MAKTNSPKETDAEAKKTCFIIMPITTPKWMLETYRDGKDHFGHVLETLFVPAIEACGLKAIPPSAEGADNIHARIIQNLELADLVLCDISSLNPNVFFELGCRSALNKAVCYVKDNLTPKIPFDNAPINHHTYSASIDGWEVKDEVDALSTHIKASLKGDPNENSLWKWFGMKANATPPVPGDPDDERYQLLYQQIGGLQRTIESLVSIASRSHLADPGMYEMIFGKAAFQKWKEEKAAALEGLSPPVRTFGPIPEPARTAFRSIADRVLMGNHHFTVEELTQMLSALGKLQELYPEWGSGIEFKHVMTALRYLKERLENPDT